MAFFAESTVQESYQELDIVVNEYTDFDVLALEACDTIQEMDNAIMSGIGRYELDMVREGTEVVYTEGMLETIKEKITKIWDFIKNWVKSVWNKFVGWISSYVRGDKAFLAKYKKQIEENAAYLSSDYEYTMKYGAIVDEIAKGDTKPVSKAHQLIESYASKIGSTTGEKDKFDDVIEDFEEKISDLKDEYKSQDLEKEVNAAWVKSNVKTILDIVDLDASKIKRIADDSVKKAESARNSAIKNIEANKNAAASDTLKNLTTLRLAAYKTHASKSSSLLTWVAAFYIKCIKGLKSDARAICRKLITAKPNPKYNESAFDHKDFGAYFDI
jgi:hypothetical protein